MRASTLTGAIFLSLANAALKSLFLIYLITGGINVMAAMTEDAIRPPMPNNCHIQAIKAADVTPIAAFHE